MLNPGGFFFYMGALAVIYDKPPLTYEQQADLILQRGIQADRDVLISKLKIVSYYRISGYLYPFRNADDSFKAGTTLDTIWHFYDFDRRLRILVLDAIERVEVAVRATLVYELVHACGPFGYTLASNFPDIQPEKHAEFVAKVSTEIERSHEVFVQHFKRKYGDKHNSPPLWMAVEVMTFGMLLTLFCGADKSIKRKISNQYGIADRVMESWLRTLNAGRNICAHHGRLWNRELGYKPTIPRERKHTEWHTPVEISNNRIFSILTILKYLLNQIDPRDDWSARLNRLLEEYPEIPRKSMGIPDNWRECPIWTRI